MRGTINQLLGDLVNVVVEVGNGRGQKLTSGMLT